MNIANYMPETVAIYGKIVGPGLKYYRNVLSEHIHLRKVATGIIIEFNSVYTKNRITPLIHYISETLRIIKSK
jgi:hypothetical protein